MKEIICRFDNQSKIDEFNLKNNLNITTNILVYDLDNNSIVKERKKFIKKKPIVDKYDAKTHYVGCPEFESKKIEAYHKIIFSTNKNISELSSIFEQNISLKTKSIWYPKLIPGRTSKYRVIGGETHTKYPIYIVSKNRSQDCTTSIYLSLMEVIHYIVVEPQDYDDYMKCSKTNFNEILVMDMKYKEEYDTFDEFGDSKSKGPGGARNFCWEHSKRNGHKWHWVMDDNANEGFHWLYQNFKIKCRSGAFFRSIEDFVDRYDNIAIGGLNYSKFCKEIDRVPPYVLNTRIYSFLLIRNDIPYRWRGRYNEDTDLSLRALKDGWCTIQFNSLLAGKATTQKIKGGNTDEFYSDEGTYNKSKMIEDMHPDVAKLVWKFNRWHHTVNYSVFKTKLKVKPDVDLSLLPKIDNYNMMIINTNEESRRDSKAYLEEKYKDVIKNAVMPIFNTYD